MKLCIGGHRFVTTRSTLTARGETYFTAMLAGRLPATRLDDGAYFIDRNGRSVSTYNSQRLHPFWLGFFAVIFSGFLKHCWIFFALVRLKCRLGSMASGCWRKRHSI